MSKNAKSPDSDKHRITKTKGVQYFSNAQLARCAEMSDEEIIRFLESFRKLHGGPQVSVKNKSKLISMKVPEDLLYSFKTRCELDGVKYQTQIKELMKTYLQSR